jgi:hypothetical protein
VAATAIRDGFGVRRRAAMCGTEWDGDDDVRLFHPGRCRWRVAGAEKKGGGVDAKTIFPSLNSRNYIEFRDNIKVMATF